MDPNLLLNGNFTSNQSGPDYLVPDGFKILFGTMLSVIFILSIIGNGLLFHALFCYMNMKNVTDMYFLHLAFSDVALTIALPFPATMLNGWFFRFGLSVYFCGMTSSIILLTTISVDQFSTVVIQNGCIVPVKRQRYAIGACTVTWMVSLAVGVHHSIYSTMDNTTCWPYQVYSYYTGLLIFLFGVTVFCYSAILWTTVRASTKNKRRTALALCISVAFFVCWAPHTILMKTSSNQHTFACHLTFLLAISHCCINPMIYMMSPKYRKHVLSIFCCEKVCTKRQR